MIPVDYGALRGGGKDARREMAILSAYGIAFNAAWVVGIIWLILSF